MGGYRNDKSTNCRAKADRKICQFRTPYRKIKFFTSESAGVDQLQENKDFLQSESTLIAMLAHMEKIYIFGKMMYTIQIEVINLKSSLQ